MRTLHQDESLFAPGEDTGACTQFRFLRCWRCATRCATQRVVFVYNPNLVEYIVALQKWVSLEILRLASSGANNAFHMLSCAASMHYEGQPLCSLSDRLSIIYVCNTRAVCPLSFLQMRAASMAPAVELGDITDLAGAIQAATEAVGAQALEVRRLKEEEGRNNKDPVVAAAVQTLMTQKVGRRRFL